MMSEDYEYKIAANLGEDIELDESHSLEHFHLPELDSKKSHVFEIFDSAPKFFYGSVVRTIDEKRNHEFLPVRKSCFTIRGHEFTVEMFPGTIFEKKSRQDDTNVYRQYYPGEVEEVICDVILKMATTQGRSAYFRKKNDENKSNGVYVWFTLYELQQELKTLGHSHNIPRIKKAIEILTRSQMTIEGKINGGKFSFSGSIFDSLAMTTKADWETFGKSAKIVIQLNSILLRSIEAGTFRLLNFEKNMSLREPVAKWLHKKLTLMWKFASPSSKDSFQILLTTILNQSGMNPKMRFRVARQSIQKALEELKSRDILISYEEKALLDPEKRKGTISDVKYFLQPSPSFISEIILANKREKTVRKKMSERALNGKINLDD